jgi:hypothetical protein
MKDRAIVIERTAEEITEHGYPDERYAVKVCGAMFFYRRKEDATKAAKRHNKSKVEQSL